MLVQIRQGETRIIRQEDHALLAGQMAAAWGAPGFQKPQPAHLVVMAVSLHDVGWQGVDRLPLWNPETFAPYNVFDLPMSHKNDFYGKGIDLAEAVHPYVGLLDSLHYGTFNFMRNSVDFQSVEGCRQERLYRLLDKSDLFADLGGVVRAADMHLQFLRLMDRLSLFICNLAPGSLARHLPSGGTIDWYKWTGALSADLFGQVPATPSTRPFTVAWDEDANLLLDPCPFSREVEVVIPYRRLEGERFETASALRAEWAASTDHTWRLVLKPG